METLTLLMSFSSMYLIPIIIASVLDSKNTSNLVTLVLLGCFIWMILSGSLTTIKLAEFKEYRENEDTRSAQLLIDHNLTNSMNTNIQYNIDKLLFEKYMKEKYGK